MTMFSFPEMVANERGYEPLLVSKASNKIRRDLLHGITVGINGFDAARYNASAALINQVCSQMMEWGFEFERPKADDSARTGFKLVNKYHVPTERVRKQRPQRPKRVDDDDNDRAESERGALTAALREALLDGEPFSARDVVKRFGGTDGNLRRVVYAMRKEGYQFDEYQGATGKTWLIKPGGPRGSKSKAVVRANGHEKHDLPVLAAMRAGGSTVTEMPPLPEFGGVLQMVGQILRPDGSIALIFRNDDEETWVTSMEGHSVES